MFRMRRGPKISQGLALAIPFALRRGHVMVFMAALLNLAELLITGNGLFVLVRVRLARKLHAGIADIEAEFEDAITGLRLVPRTGPVSCELWLYSRHGTLRHFRVKDAGLVEIDCYGTPLDKVKPKVTGLSSGGNEAPAPHKPVVTGPAAPSTKDASSPIIRWLAKWNAARKAGGGADAVGNIDLKRILDAGVPGGKAKRNPGKKPADKEPAAAGSPDPENISEPEKLVREGTLASTISASKEKPRNNTPGSLEISREEGDLPEPSEKEGVI